MKVKVSTDVECPHCILLEDCELELLVKCLDCAYDDVSPSDIGWCANVDFIDDLRFNLAFELGGDFLNED